MGLTSAAEGDHCKIVEAGSSEVRWYGCGPAMQAGAGEMGGHAVWGGRVLPVQELG